MGQKETIRISRNRLFSRVSVTLTCFRFKDKETKQYVFYAPSLELSGYGRSPEKAKEMFDFQLKEVLTQLSKMKQDHAKAYLRSYGWAQEKYANKNFSHAYVDKNGVLQNFNLDPDEVTEEKIVKTEEQKMVAA